MNTIDSRNTTTTSNTTPIESPTYPQLSVNHNHTHVRIPGKVRGYEIRMYANAFGNDYGNPPVTLALYNEGHNQPVLRAGAGTVWELRTLLLDHFKAIQVKDGMASSSLTGILFSPEASHCSPGVASFWSSLRPAQGFEYTPYIQMGRCSIMKGETQPNSPAYAAEQAVESNTKGSTGDNLGKIWDNAGYSGEDLSSPPPQEAVQHTADVSTVFTMEGVKIKDMNGKAEKEGEKMAEKADKRPEETAMEIHIEIETAAANASADEELDAIFGYATDAEPPQKPLPIIPYRGIPEVTPTPEKKVNPKRKQRQEAEVLA